MHRSHLQFRKHVFLVFEVMYLKMNSNRKEE